MRRPLPIAVLIAWLAAAKLCCGAVAFLAHPRTGGFFRTQSVSEVDGPHNSSVPQPGDDAEIAAFRARLATQIQNTQLIVRDDDGNERVLVSAGALDFSTCADGRHLLASVVSASRGDVYRIDVATGERQQLTNGPGWNCQPVELGNGDVAFLSDRDNWRNPGENYRAFTIYHMSAQGREVERIWHAGFGGVFGLHCGPDGRLYFSSGENQGGAQAAGTNWAIWSINPDGGDFRPEISSPQQFSPSDMPFDFSCIASDGSLIATRYYDTRIYGALYRCPLPRRFGSPLWPNNPPVGALQNYNSWQRKGMHGLTDWTHDNDDDALFEGRNVGHVSHPAPCPGNGIYLTWTGTHGDGHMQLGVYQLPSVVQAIDHQDRPEDVQVVVDEPDRHEWMGKPLVPYADLYGKDRPASPISARDPKLPSGSPFFTLGSSDVANWNEWLINAVEPANVRLRKVNRDYEPVWIRILGMRPSKFVNTGQYEGVQNRYFGGYGGDSFEGFVTPTNERIGFYTKLIPLQKWRFRGELGFGPAPADISYDDFLRRPNGTLDTSFRAELPANQCWTFQLLDENMQAIVTANTWHQGIPGESHVTCQGCHAHERPDPVLFEETFAASDEYPRMRLDQIQTIVYERDVQPYVRAPRTPWYSETGGHALAFESWRQGYDDNYLWSEVQRRIYRSWQDTGYLAAGRDHEGRPVQPPFGPYADTMQPTLVVRKYDNYTAVGACDPDSGIADLQVFADGNDITDQFTPLPGEDVVFRPGSDLTNSVVSARAIDGAGNVTEVERIRVDERRWFPAALAGGTE